MSEPNLRILLRSSDVANKIPANTHLLREGDPSAGDKQGSELAVVHLVDPDVNGDPNLVDSTAGIYFKLGTTLDGTSRNKIVKAGAVFVTSTNTRPETMAGSNADVDYTGNLWYRLDNKELYINETGAQSSSAWQTLTPRYDRSQPTPYTVGGVQEGDTFDNLTLQEVFDKIFYPSGAGILGLDITPSPLSNNAVSKKVELGEAIPPPSGSNQRVLSVRTGSFTSVSSISYLAGTDFYNLSAAESIFAGATYSGSGKDRILTYTQASDLVYSAPTKFYWRALITDTENNQVPGPYVYVEWAYLSLSFSSTATSVADPFASYTTAVTSMGGVFGDDLGVNGPQAKHSRITTAGKMVTGSAEYLYVCLPIGRVVGGVPVLDGYTTYASHDTVFGSGVALNTPTEVDVVRNGVTVRYWVYRTTAATTAAITLTFV